MGITAVSSHALQKKQQQSGLGKAYLLHVSLVYQRFI